MSSWVTRVCTLIREGFEVAFCRLKTVTVSPGMSGALGSFLAAEQFPMFKARTDAGDPELTENHPVASRDENDTTTFEPAALHHELAIDRVRWFDDFTMVKYWRSPDAVWYTAGWYDQLHFGSEVDMKELARQTQNNAEDYDDPDNIDGFDSGFYSGPRGAHLRNTLPSKSGYVWENAGCVSSDRVAAGCSGRGPAASNMTSLVAAALGTPGDVAAGLSHSGGPGVALPCAPAKRSRLLPEFVDDCSRRGRRLSPRQRAIIPEFHRGGRWRPGHGLPARL